SPYVITAAAASIAPDGSSPSYRRASAGRETATRSAPVPAQRPGSSVTATSGASGEGASGSTTVAPVRHAARAHTAVRQCTGRSRVRRVPGAASNSSTRRFTVLLTQLASTAPESSTRSPSSPYQVRRGRPPSAARRARRAATSGTGPPPRDAICLAPPYEPTRRRDAPTGENHGPRVRRAPRPAEGLVNSPWNRWAIAHFRLTTP